MKTLEIRKLKSELSAAKQINFNNSLIIKRFDSKNILLEEKNKSLLEENKSLREKNNWSSINKKNYKMNQIYKQFNIFEKSKI